ncbi:hypothetical protein KIW84_021231 [Lathyrus oleraceus]|uniref:Subtilisin-like protease fibronectin type-III domain-containing protein n=1 Tax=Pisum sativum TaxID=3888 RepID=A0A9D5B8B7_PEA|nr:hypothetical protein KIW84_021231 [Pisum sativum]
MPSCIRSSGVHKVIPSHMVTGCNSVGSYDNRFLCGQGFKTTDLRQITRDDSICSNTSYPSARDLNYPSFALNVQSSTHSFRGSFRRTVTNVGRPNSIYTANVTAPEGLHISVNPAK